MWRYRYYYNNDNGEKRDDEPILADAAVALMNPRHVLRRIKKTLCRTVDAVADVVNYFVLKLKTLFSKIK